MHAIPRCRHIIHLHWFDSAEYAAASDMRGLLTMSPQASSGAEAAEGASSIGLSMLWNVFVTALVGYFALSCVHEFARVRAPHPRQTWGPLPNYTQ